MIGHALHRRPSVRVALLIAISAVVALPGCGGSSPTAPQPPPTPTTITFNPTAVVGLDSIGLAFASSTATELTLSLRTNNVSDLFGYGVDLVFDPSIIAFDSAEAGTFLDGEGITVALQVVEPTPGTLVIGQTRVGAVAGASGSGVLLTLRFRAAGAGGTSLTTATAAAFASDGSQQTTSFFGGTVTVPGS